MTDPERRRLLALLPLAALALSAAAWLPARRLRVDTDLVSLLPDRSPAVDAYRLFLDHFGGLERMFVLVSLGDGDRPGAEGARVEAATTYPADGVGPGEAACELASVLERSPLVRDARCGIEEADEEFVLRHLAPRAPLFLDDDWQRQVAERTAPEALRRRAAEIHGMLTGPAGRFRAPWVAVDPLGFAEDLLAGGVGTASLPVDPATGAFVSVNGRWGLVIAIPRQSELDADGGRRLLATLNSAAGDLRRGSPAFAPLRVLAVGGPLYAAQDEAALRGDLRSSLALSAVSCALLLVVVFDSLWIPLLFLSAVGLALEWTAGFVQATLGGISGACLGFAAVLIGLGVDFGIHLGTRFRQDLAEGSAPWPALEATYRGTARGLLAAALTTAGACGVLALASFRPLRETGIGIAAGILFMLVGSVTLAPALVAVVRLPGSRRRPGPVWRGLGGATVAAVRFAGRRPATVLTAAAVLTAFSVIGLARLSLDPSLETLRPEDHPAFEAERVLSDGFGLGLETVNVVVRGEELGQALDRARAVEGAVRPHLPDGAEVTSPAHWLVAERSVETRNRLAELSRMGLVAAADRLAADLRAEGLAPEAFASGLNALRALGRGEDPAPPPPASWPEWVRDLVRERADGTWAAVRLRLPAGTWAEGPPAGLMEAVWKAAPGAAVASVGRLGAELRSVAARDLLRLALVALAVVTVVVVASFRGRLLPSVLALVPVSLGTLWTLGLWSLAGGRLDLLSAAVIPILLGIGIDDGLHALHAARRVGRQGLGEGLAAAVGEVGRATALTTLTTAVAFGSLATSSIPGLRRGGMVVAIGVLAALVATLVVLPALAVKLTPAGGHGE